MKAPLFVKIDEYKEIMDLLAQVNSKLDEADKAIKKLNELKQQEDQEVTGWQAEVDSVKQKLSAITDSLSSSTGTQ